MDIRQITPTYSVSPQIDPSDIAEVAAQGYTTILCNRPDPEIPPSHHAAEMRRAVEAAGLRFVENPLVHGAMTEDIVALQHDTIAHGTRTLAYCASGTRSTVCWMLSEAPHTDPDTLLEMAARGGYQLYQLRPQLEMLYKSQR